MKDKVEKEEADTLVIKYGLYGNREVERAITYLESKQTKWSEYWEYKVLSLDVWKSKWKD